MMRWIFVILTVLMGCTQPVKRSNNPKLPLHTVHPFGVPGLRLPADAPIDDWRRITDPARMAEQPKILALSGGADDGAFGAGLLVGWTARGDRPEFDIVTGVSAGAIIAPLAFLGARYDAHLSEIFARFDAHDIAEPLGILGLLGVSLYDTGPLRRLISQIIDEDVIQAIAEAHRDGRRLFIVTTDLDRERAIVWNMGAIADLDESRRSQLFHDVMLASSSIPGLFPPVEINVFGARSAFVELHIDGGAALEFLAVPDLFIRNGVWPHGEAAGAQLFVVVNSRLSTRTELIPARLVRLVERSLSTLIRSYQRQSAERVLAFGQRTGVAVGISAIPPDFEAPRSRWFEPAYMRAVFDHGWQLGRSGRG